MAHDGAVRILIVDDSAQIHTNFRRILLADPARGDLDALEQELFGDAPAANRQSATGQTYELDSAYQGAEAVDLIERAAREGRPYSIVFCDMRMPPGYDGVTTIRKIWEHQPNVEAVICTAYSDCSWNEIVRELGVSDRLLLLKKPFDPAEVQQIALALTCKWRLTERERRRIAGLEVALNEKTLEVERARLLAEAASRAKSEFLENLCRDIRTPANAIIASVNKLEIARLTHEQRAVLVSVRQSADLLLKIVDDAIELSNIEAGRLESAPRSR